MWEYSVKGEETSWAKVQFLHIPPAVAYGSGLCLCGGAWVSPCYTHRAAGSLGLYGYVPYMCFILLLIEHETLLCLQTFEQTRCGCWWALLLGLTLSGLHGVGGGDAVFPRRNTGKSGGTSSSPFPTPQHVQCSGIHQTRASPGTGPLLLASMCIYPPLSSLVVVSL